MAIYQGDKKVSGAGVQVDSALSDTSTRPVENMVLSKPLVYATKYVQNQVIKDMQTQAVVDATELVSATGAVRNVDLNLSSNTELKKLKAAGTADDLLTGISSVIVSPEAPFDSELSPQLDVSYTGLSRAALVNMFNSMPYNVGYEVVGSPTISNGIVSNFTNNDYLLLSKFPGYDGDYEFQVAFTQTTSGDAGLMTGHTFLYGGLYIASGRINFAFRNSEGVTMSVTTTNTVAQDVPYIANAKRTGNSLTLTVYKNGVLDETVTADLTGITASDSIAPIRIGQGASGFLNGSINLANTYIKINDTVWFRGMQSFVKTCSVVGCTGTADLTAEDKALCTGKGWELTLS